MTATEFQGILDAAVERIVGRFDPEKIILFGSYANGEVTPDSDLDLLIVMDLEGSRRRKANEIDLALADRMIPMDISVVTPEQFDRQKNAVGTIIREAALQGRVLYERAA